MIALLPLVYAAVVGAATIRVDVGLEGGLTYTPDSITAEEGDTLDFYFVGGFHDVVMGNFSTPCKPSTDGGFASGSVAGNAANVSAPIGMLYMPTQPYDPI